MIKFNKFNVTDTETKKKAKVNYSLDNRIDERKCVTLYAQKYDNILGEIFADSYKNETDTLTDYFDKGKLVVSSNGFQKKTKKTPKQEIGVALISMEEYKNKYDVETFEKTLSEVYGRLFDRRIVEFEMMCKNLEEKEVVSTEK